MRIIRNLLCVFLTMVFVSISGCTNNNQASPAPKPSAKAEKTVAMNYDLKDRDAFTIMGIQTRITSANEKNPDTYIKIWDAFDQYRTQLRPISIELRFFGVTFAIDKKGDFDYLAGVSVHSDAAAPDPNLVTRTVPAARYAVFKCTGENIDKTYEYIFSQWLPASRYKPDRNACSFEQYAPREWMNRPVYIYIPIVPK
ncbi:MAG: GyrI-like domain-containing protein [Sedimentisphaerales bacterium]